MEKKTLNESIIDIRVDLQKSKLKKSGYNDYSHFEYFELADFLPKLNELMQREKINDIFTIVDDYATLSLLKGDETNVYKIPFVIFETPLTKNGVPSMQDIQYLGALNTYYKRYLYMNAFGITDGEIIDSMNNNEITKEKKSKKVEKNDIPKIDYKTALLDELKARNINIPSYIKTHELGANTTQKKAYELLKELKNEKNDKNEVKNGN